MTHALRCRAPWFLWPFAALLDVAALFLHLVGRSLLVALGLALMVCGGLATLTLVGAPVGLPVAFVGLLLVVRGLF